MLESGIDPARNCFLQEDFALPNPAQTWQDCNQLNENHYSTLQSPALCAGQKGQGRRPAEGLRLPYAAPPLFKAFTLVNKTRTGRGRGASVPLGLDAPDEAPVRLVLRWQRVGPLVPEGEGLGAFCTCVFRSVFACSWKQLLFTWQGEAMRKV